MKLINKLLKLTMLITCNQLQKSSHPRAEKALPWSHKIDSGSSSATVSMAVLTLSPSFYKTINWGKENNVVSIHKE